MNSNYLEENIVKLVSISNQFIDMKMPKTSITIMKFPELLRKDTVKISSLEKIFENTLKNAEQEFGNRDEHSKNCIQLMMHHLRILLTGPYYDHFLDELIPIMKRREPTADNWRSHIKIIARKEQSHQENFVGLSSEYAMKIEGLYKIDAHICYLLSKFAMEEIISWKKIENTDIGIMKKYYKENFDDVSLFEGWNNHLRNSIAHATYYYEKEKMTMRYEDKQSNWKEELSYDDLFEMSQKIIDVCETIDVLVRLIPVRKFSMIKDFERFKLLGIDVVCL